MPRNGQVPGSRVATAVLLIVGVAALYLARAVLVPIALAILLSFLLAPVVVRLQRAGIHRVVAVLAVVTLAFAVILAVAGLASRQLVDLAQHLPEYKENVKLKVRAIRAGSKGGVVERVGETIGEIHEEVARPDEAPSGDGGAEGAAETETLQAPTAPAAAPGTPMRQSVPAPQAQPVPVTIVQPPPNLFTVIRSALGPMLEPLATAGIVIVFVIFILLKREDLRDRMIRVMGGGKLHVTTQMLSDAGQRVSRYLLMQSIINGTYGLAIGAGLYFIGVPNALLWGLLAALLRFLPYVGPWIAALMPLAVSVAAFPGWTQAMLTAGLFIVCELISNNVMEPWLYGSGTGISSVAVLASAVFWTWLWGPIGLLLATPLTVCIVVIGRHVPQLHFIHVMLSDEPALSPDMHLYQRLLAMDQFEATEAVDRYLQSHTVEELFDDVIAPALILAEEDRHREELSDAQERFIDHTIRELIEMVSERVCRTGEVEGRPRVMILPARDSADELAGQMLGCLLSKRGIEATVVSADELASERLERVQFSPVELVAISALPPVALMHAHYLVKRFKARFPATRLLVGLWTARDQTRVRERLELSEADIVATQIRQAADQVQSILPAEPPKPVSDRAPLPGDEAQRLAELEQLDLLDTDPEETFDHFTDELTRAFDVPIALVSLVDRDRQWWKSHVGLPEELTRARCTPREMSVCSYVVAHNQTLVVEDLSKDARFAQNPFLRRLGARFYAGAPLRTQTGRPIGSLCVMDTRPREFTKRERETLELLADAVMAQVRLRSIERRRQRDEQAPPLQHEPGPAQPHHAERH